MSLYKILNVANHFEEKLEKQAQLIRKKKEVKDYWVTGVHMGLSVYMQPNSKEQREKILNIILEKWGAEKGSNILPANPITDLGEKGHVLETNDVLDRGEALDLAMMAKNELESRNIRSDVKVFIYHAWPQLSNYLVVYPGG